MTGQAICFTASEGLAYKCPLEAKSLASPQFIRSGMTTIRFQFVHLYTVVEAVHSERYDNKGGSRTCTLARSSGRRSFLRFAISELQNFAGVVNLTGSSPPKTGNLPTEKKKSVILTLLAGLLNPIRIPLRGCCFLV